jgi:hypothetical protein
VCVYVCVCVCVGLGEFHPSPALMRAQTLLTYFSYLPRWT